MQRYFAYGSNLCREQMNKRCPDNRVVGRGVLRTYRWIISERGYANVVNSSEEDVHGIVYEISKSDEKKLDRCEGVHTGSYVKKLLSVEVIDSPVVCLVYVDPIETEGSPSREYAQRINRGLKDAELPSDYVREHIRPFVPG